MAKKKQKFSSAQKRAHAAARSAAHARESKTTKELRPEVPPEKIVPKPAFEDDRKAAIRAAQALSGRGAN